MKSERIEILRSILTFKEIRTQESLLKELEKAGHPVTQATLSRDLQHLKAAKVAFPDGYRYIIPEMRVESSPKIRIKPVGGKHDIDFMGYEVAGGMVVVHTRPGYAQGLAADIDQFQFDSVAGTVAGNNTILIVIRNGYTSGQVVEDLSTILPIPQ